MRRRLVQPVIGPAKKIHRILAVDPAYSGKTGWALFNEGRLEGYGALPAKRAKDRSVREVLLRRADCLVIEMEYLSRDPRKRNPHSFRVLGEARAWWERMAIDVVGIPVNRMMLETWARATTGNRSVLNGSAKNTVQTEYYLRRRWRLSGDLTISPDELSALAIGTVFLDQNALAAGMARIGA